MTTFENLPYLSIQQIALTIPFNDIRALCYTNKRFKQTICGNQEFWYDKLVRDYGITEEYSETLDWKKIYESYVYRLIGIGLNRFGQLGLGYETNVGELTNIPTVPFKDVVCDEGNTIIIDEDGNLWETGSKFDRKTGWSINNTNEFVQLTHDLKFVQVACGKFSTLALSEDNKIWITGNIGYGPIELEGVDRVDQFTELENFRAKQISCRGVNFAFIDLNGNLYSFGFNNYGQLGRGISSSQIYKIPGRVLIDVPIIQVSCGPFHTACIDINNDIWVVGYNRFGQLGLDKLQEKGHPERMPNHKAKYISCGSYSTAFIDLEDHVWVCGLNNHQQLGLMEIKSSHSPIKITKVYHEGQIVNMDFKVRKVYCSEYVTLFIDLNENLWVTGKNKYLNIVSDVPAMVPGIKANKAAISFQHMVIRGYYN